MAINYTPKPLPAQQRLGFNISAFYGVNKTGTAANGEFIDCRNMSSDNFPYASPREPREVIASGIVNPQRLLFCGDRLSYIAGGKLNVKNGDAFDEVGEVGNVTSAVDFNNQKMLFYPTNIEYEYKTGDISTITKYLTLRVGSYGGKASSTIHGFSETCDNVNVYWRGNRYNHRKCATIAISSGESSEYINATAKEKKDDEGNTVYNEITINVTGNNPQYITDGFKNDSRFMKLFVRAWDDKGNLISSSDFDETNYTANYTECGFGKPILFNGVAPAKILAMIGYYYTPTTTNWNGFCDQGCITQRNDDLDNENFKVWVTATEYPAENSQPAINYACMDNNRVVAVEGNNFYASCLGDYTNWTDFVDAEGNPKAKGAYAEELCTYGDFTGIIKYNSNVILTKADLTYICYGNKPPYRINELCNVGCIKNETIAEVDGYLYWLGRDGVYMFGGGTPRLISDKVKITPTDGVACGYEHKYYLCANDGESFKLYVYDTQKNLWHIEDERQYVSLTSKDGALYGLTADGEILKFNSGSERVEWEFTTSDFDFNTEYTKNLAKIYVRMKLYNQTYVDIYVRSNRQDWYRFANFKADGTSVIQAKAKLKKCDYFTLRFVGYGKAEIMDVYADVTLGSQKHRSGDKLAVFRKS